MTMSFTVIKERCHFLQDHFNDSLFDLKVFHMAENILDDYKGGYWDYVITDEGVPFLNPVTGYREVVLVNPFSGVAVAIPTSSKLAGMIVTAYTLQLSIEHGNNFLVDVYDELTSAIYNVCADLNRLDIWTNLLD
jgi:hypothetical protein